MHAGLGLGHGAVVHLHRSWLALDEDALHGLPVAGYPYALGHGGVVITDRHGNLSLGIAGVDQIHCDEPVAGFGGTRKGALATQVGKSLVDVNPVTKKPGEIAAVSGLLKEGLELARMIRVL